MQLWLRLTARKWVIMGAIKVHFTYRLTSDPNYLEMSNFKGEKCPPLHLGV